MAPERLGSVNQDWVVRASIARASTNGTTCWRARLKTARCENVHAFRIQLKRMRYRVELARDLGVADAKPLIGWFKTLQDRLGHWHDRQELNHFIARALTNYDVLLKEPRVAMELLKEVEKNIAISSREVSALFQDATASEGCHQFEGWIESYCGSGENGRAKDPLLAQAADHVAEDQLAENQLAQSAPILAELAADPTHPYRWTKRPQRRKRLRITSSHHNRKGRLRTSSMKKAANEMSGSDGTRLRTLAVDIGGTGIKTIILDEDGKPLTERERTATPPHATPKQVIAIIEQMGHQQGEFDRVSVGFPGVVKDGKLLTAFNLGPGWAKFDFQKALSKQLMRPVRIANDADVQGSGCG